MKTLIKKGHLVDPSQHLDAVKDILVEDGIIKRVADSIEEAADETYDASGKVVAPGFIDLHTHLREPGLWQRLTVALRASPACRTRTLSSIPRLS